MELRLGGTISIYTCTCTIGETNVLMDISGVIPVLFYVF